MNNSTSPVAAHNVQRLDLSGRISNLVKAKTPVAMVSNRGVSRVSQQPIPVPGVFGGVAIGAVTNGREGHE